MAKERGMETGREGGRRGEEGGGNGGRKRGGGMWALTCCPSAVMLRYGPVRPSG